MSIHRQSVNVYNVTAFPTDPQVEIPFEPRSIMVINQDQDGDAVEISFDGVNVHARLLYQGPSSGLVFNQLARRVWLRSVGAGTSPTDVEVIAER